MKYKNMDNTELWQEMLRVQKVINNAKDVITYRQNRKYLDNLQREWIKRHAQS